MSPPLRLVTVLTGSVKSPGRHCAAAAAARAPIGTTVRTRFHSGHLLLAPPHHQPPLRLRSASALSSFRLSARLPHFLPLLLLLLITTTRNPLLLISYLGSSACRRPSHHSKASGSTSSGPPRFVSNRAPRRLSWLNIAKPRHSDSSASDSLSYLQTTWLHFIPPTQASSLREHLESSLPTLSILLARRPYLCTLCTSIATSHAFARFRTLRTHSARHHPCRRRAHICCQAHPLVHVHVHVHVHFQRSPAAPGPHPPSSRHPDSTTLPPSLHQTDRLTHHSGIARILIASRFHLCHRNTSTRSSSSLTPWPALPDVSSLASLRSTHLDALPPAASVPFRQHGVRLARLGPCSPPPCPWRAAATRVLDV